VPTLRDSGLACFRAAARVARQHLFGDPGYDIELKVYAIEENSPPPALPPRLAGTCEEIPLPNPTRNPFRYLPSWGTVRIWYRDSVFAWHFIDEFPL
jgi:hypothetical protein